MTWAESLAATLSVPFRLLAGILQVWPGSGTHLSCLAGQLKLDHRASGGLPGSIGLLDLERVRIGHLYPALNGKELDVQVFG